MGMMRRRPDIYKQSIFVVLVRLAENSDLERWAPMIFFTVFLRLLATAGVQRIENTAKGRDCSCTSMGGTPGVGIEGEWSPQTVGIGGWKLLQLINK